MLSKVITSIYQSPCNQNDISKNLIAYIEPHPQGSKTFEGKLVELDATM